MILLLILYGNLILVNFINKNKTFELLLKYRYKNKTLELFKNYSFNNNSFEFLENYEYKIKTFQFLIEHEFNVKINKQIDLDYKNINFAVIQAPCIVCGLFSNYIIFLGCIRKYMIQGFIPILEVESYKNAINGFIVDPLKGNPWEYYFNQPFGYQYSNIKNKAKNIKYIKCHSEIRPNKGIFLNKKTANFWHNFANQYMPIKDEIIKESNFIISKIFKKSRNLLGVLLRGTDYVAKKPYAHSIPHSGAVLHTTGQGLGPKNSPSRPVSAAHRLDNSHGLPTHSYVPCPSRPFRDPSHHCERAPTGLP